MTDLTELWKKRTLRNGAYYIKMLGGDILPAFCNTDYILKQFQTMKGIYSDVEEVLSPVPSYQKYLALESDSLAKKEGEEIIAELEAENAQLKKWCEEFNALDVANVAKENKKLKKQLVIAIEALKCYEQENWVYEDEYNYFSFNEDTGGWCHAEKALKKIKELDK